MAIASLKLASSSAPTLRSDAFLALAFPPAGSALASTFLAGNILVVEGPTCFVGSGPARPPPELAFVPAAVAAAAAAAIAAPAVPAVTFATLGGAGGTSGSDTASAMLDSGEVDVPLGRLALRELLRRRAEAETVRLGGVAALTGEKRSTGLEAREDCRRDVGVSDAVEDGRVTVYQRDEDGGRARFW